MLKKLTVDGSEIRLTSWYGRLSHHLQGFIHPRRLFGISSINSSASGYLYNYNYHILRVPWIPFANFVIPRFHLTLSFQDPIRMSESSSSLCPPLKLTNISPLQKGKSNFLYRDGINFIGYLLVSGAIIPSSTHVSFVALPRGESTESSCTMPPKFIWQHAMTKPSWHSGSL